MTTDAIGVTAFAMDVNSQRDPNTQFAQYSKEVQKLSFGDWRILFSGTLQAGHGTSYP